MEKIVYPSLVSGTMAELVSFYNEHSGQEPIKKFKDKATAQQAVQVVIAQLEGDEDPELDEVMDKVQEDASSLLSQLAAAGSGSGKTNQKNEGVWSNVRQLLDSSNGQMTNKEILAEIHERYGNTNTSYACIAWYRNKWKKSAPSLSLDERIKAAQEALDALLTEKAAAEQPAEEQEEGGEE